jgi:hypothetical protein
MFTLTIKTDNAAFHADDRADDADGFDGTACGAELARILRELAEDVSNGVSDETAIAVRDGNGNKVGEATFII